MPNIAKPIRVIETLSTALLVSAKLQPNCDGATAYN